MTFSDETIEWEADGRKLRIGLTRAGTGPRLLMLPAPSSISTRAELRPLQERLADRYTCIAADLPGFGEGPKPKIDWRPDHLRSWISLLLREIVKPDAILAAGHAAGYVIDHAARHPGGTGPLLLLSPTWRGPLPTMAGKRLPIFGAMARAVDPPVAGAAFYRLNVNGPVIRMMARGHVYGDPAWFTPERMAEKRKVTESPGARHASFRFVTGELDPFTSREDFLAAASQASTRINVLYGARTPRKTMAEIAALSALPHVTSLSVAQGKLSFYEEHPDQTAEGLLSLLT